MKNALLSIVAGASLGGIYVLSPFRLPTAIENVDERETLAHEGPRVAPDSEETIVSVESSNSLTRLDEVENGTDTVTASPHVEIESLQPAVSAVAAIAPVPIPVPPQIQRLLDENATVASIHALLESQPFDPVWGPSMETKIITFFSQNPEFGMPTVHCRSGWCEIYVVSNDSGYDRRRPIIELRRQPWAAELALGGLTGGTHDGQTAALWFVRRDP